MLTITIISIGKTNEAYVKQGIEKYSTLLLKHGKIEWIELPDVKNSNKLPIDKLKEAEAELISSALPAKAALFFLDEVGKQMNSVEFATYLGRKSTEFSKLVFIIGGSYGLHPSIKQKGESISLSAMTFNHQMVRVILAEQIFRAFTIVKNTGYHH
ncbi:MAG: 23S rRNA (pseudouridine(1915)-N(3))-methyltransferase RlmH [bacterium]|nr:23S rRNA (pseudouridine(1915)-N(3))-methyltransferase RlmH [bacterium]